MHVTIAAITVLATCLLLLLLRLSSLNAEYKLKHQELLHQALKAQKEQTDQLFYGMTCIVDRYTVVDLLKDRYEYHEYSSNSLYPETGSYQNLLDKKLYRIIRYRKYKNKPSAEQRIPAESAA